MRYKTINNFLSDEECDTLISLSRSRLQVSTTWDGTIGASVVSDERQSDYMFFEVVENPLVAKIEKKIADTVGLPMENGEGMQVVRYGVGGYYHMHHDYFGPRFMSQEYVQANGGQRVLTFMMYLSDVKKGGETYFPEMDLSVTPEKGKALTWLNVTEEDVDKSSRHEARPVLEGEKWIATKWIRQGVYVK